MPYALIGSSLEVTNNYYKYEKLSVIISFSSGCSTSTRDKTEEQVLH